MNAGFTRSINYSQLPKHFLHIAWFMIAVSMDILKADQLFLLFRPHSSVQRECPSAQKLYIFCTLFHLLETVHFLYTFLQYLSSFLTAPQSSLLIKRKYIISPYGCPRAVITTHFWLQYFPYFVSSFIIVKAVLLSLFTGGFTILFLTMGSRRTWNTKCIDNTKWTSKL